MPKPKKTKEAPVELKNSHIVVDGEVKFPDRKLKEYTGVDALSAAEAKGLLGWTEESETNKFLDGSWQFKDENRMKVRCLNNLHNRPYDDSRARRYSQEILNRHWFFNGETIIVGKYGNVLSGQHRLIGLVLASQIWAQPAQHEHWKQHWPKEPVLECAIYYGISEDAEVIRTLDNVMPRTLSDILFSQPEMAHWKVSDRKHLAKIAEWAVRYLWSRTGDKKHGNRAFNPFLTPSEALEFIHNHPKLIQAVDHIYRINQKVDEKIKKDGTKVEVETNANVLGPFATPGMAAGMLYLMGTYDSDAKAYRTLDVPNEAILCLDYWDKACDFWTSLGAPINSPSGKAMQEIRDSFTRFPVNDDTVKSAWKHVVLAKAWRQYAVYSPAEGQPFQPFTEGDLTLEFSEPDEKYGFRSLLEYEDFGGIDLGSEAQRRKQAAEAKALEPDTVDELGDNSDPDVVAAKAEKIRMERLTEADAKAQRIQMVKDRVEARRQARGIPKTEITFDDDSEQPADEDEMAEAGH